MNEDVVGLIELTSISDGYLVLDAIVKEAPVNVLRAEVINPGKFFICISGDIASVETSMNQARVRGSEYLHDISFLKNLDSSVYSRIQRVYPPQEWDSLGLIETSSIVSAIEAADVAVKVADVEVVEITSSNETGGKSLLKLNGPVGDMHYAVEQAAELIQNKGRLVRSVVISAPHSDMKRYVSGN